MIIKHNSKDCEFNLEINLKGFKKVTNNNLYNHYTNNYEDVIIKAIPYACFANRNESNMLVWIKCK